MLEILKEAHKIKKNIWFLRFSDNFQHFLIFFKKIKIFKKSRNAGNFERSAQNQKNIFLVFTLFRQFPAFFFVENF
jgi:hypothetical protein